MYNSRNFQSQGDNFNRQNLQDSHRMHTKEFFYRQGNQREFYNRDFSNQNRVDNVY